MLYDFDGAEPGGHMMSPLAWRKRFPWVAFQNGSRHRKPQVETSPAYSSRGSLPTEAARIIIADIGKAGYCSVTWSLEGPAARPESL